MPITFRRLTESDFPLLRTWLARPHVARWWNHDTSVEGVAADFGPTVRGEEPAEDFVVSVDGAAIGLVQRCVLADYPEYEQELAQVLEVPEHAATIDYLIGDPADTGRGLGTRIIGAIVDRTWTELPHVATIVVPIVAANTASWRALEKAGFRRVAAGELEPDNPVDDRLHFVYRIDR